MIGAARVCIELIKSNRNQPPRRTCGTDLPKSWNKNKSKPASFILFIYFAFSCFVFHVSSFCSCLSMSFLILRFLFDISCRVFKDPNGNKPKILFLGGGYPWIILCRFLFLCCIVVYHKIISLSFLSLLCMCFWHAFIRINSINQSIN